MNSKGNAGYQGIRDLDANCPVDLMAGVDPSCLMLKGVPEITQAQLAHKPTNIVLPSIPYRLRESSAELVVPFTNLPREHGRGRNHCKAILSCIL